VKVPTGTSVDVSTKLERIAKLAREAPDMAVRNLAHYIDIDWLREAYRRTRKDGALGVDGQSAEEYASHLEDNLQALLDRAKSGTYRAPPVRRVHIPKGSGAETRPLGIPTFEDKVLQRAVVMVLEAVYEQEFLDCSYGFRAKRSAHQALEALQHQSVVMAGGWIVEIDIRKYFDRIDHGHLREILRRRVHDGVLLLQRYREMTRVCSPKMTRLTGRSELVTIASLVGVPAAPNPHWLARANQRCAPAKREDGAVLGRGKGRLCRPLRGCALAPPCASA
jgi:retron-type reverse transcriptase